jgi:hypothetical protein
VINWSWKKESKISVWNPDQGKIFIVVTASIWVSGYSDFNTNPFNFKLDADSTSYSHSIATYSLSDRFSDGVVPDGGTRTGTLVFEIPLTVAIVGLRYEAIFKSYNIRYQQRGRCLIATAAYGSDLAPQVQALREIRDLQVMNTFAGRQFMQTFECFYYSFSPQVAEFISSSPPLAGLSRIVLAPLLQILTMVRGETELQLILSGTVASALIGLMYLSIPLAATRAFAKHGRNAKK